METTCSNRRQILIGMDLHSDKIALSFNYLTPDGPVEYDRVPSGRLCDLEQIYKNRRVSKRALTVFEATGNAFFVARKLSMLGYQAKVLKSDILVNISQRGKVNDTIDALNLARTYAFGNRSEVYVPSREVEGWRDLISYYAKMRSQKQRYYNYIWAYCNARGFQVSQRKRTKTPEAIRKQVAQYDWLPEERFILNQYIDNFEHHLKLFNNAATRIRQVVESNEDMLRTMSILGFGPIVAFALVASIGDIHRFESGHQLASYIGFTPFLCESGKSKGPNHITRRGNSFLRALITEGMQCALRKGKSRCHQWARAKIMRGENYNKIICALARKVLTYVWHALKGHPIPESEPTKSYCLKLSKLATDLGKDYLRTQGYSSTKEFVAAHCAVLWGSAPDPAPSRPTQPTKGQREIAS